MKPAALLILAGAGLLLTTVSAGAQTPAAQAAATAAAAPAAKSGGIGSSKDPIDISAQTTEVFQTEHRVVYRGEVEALQGVQRLRTPQLTLFFAQREGAPKAATSGGMGAGFGSIQRMEAEGPVFLVTPTQAARGDHGTYEAASDTITLTGNVTLKQDKNIATGDRLVIDQKSGHTTLTSGSKSRVRGVFYPDNGR